LARGGGVDEFELDVFTHALEVAVAPIFVRIRRSGPAALIHGPVPVSAGRMGIHFVRGAPHDVDLAPVGFPTRDAGSVVLVGVGDAAIVFLFEGVFRRIGVGITALPERLDELLAFFVCRKVQERAALLGSDDVDHILVQPLLVLGVEFLVEVAFVLLLVLIGLFGMLG